MGNVKNRRLSLRPTLINRYSLPRASISIIAPYDGTYLYSIDQQAVDFLSLALNCRIMPQAFQTRRFLVPKMNPKQEACKSVPYHFGILSTQDAVDRIAEESSLMKGDVLNMLDRYQRYVTKNLQKGYKVELEGAS